jgi:hypothetical protein
LNASGFLYYFALMKKYNVACLASGKALSGLWSVGIHNNYNNVAYLALFTSP